MKYNSKILLVTAMFAAATLASHAQLQEKISTYPTSQVRLTGGEFLHAENLDIQYLLALDADRLLAPYLKGVGLTPKAENYTNWENTGLDGHIGGHYLSALSWMWAATGDERIGKRLNYVLSELKRCQDAAGDGYLCGVPNGRAMWKEIASGNIRANAFGLNDRWVPLYNIHKIYAGLRDAWIQAHREDAKEMLIKLADWNLKLVESLSDAQIQQMLVSEHGGLNEVFADVADITGDAKYLKLAERYSHRFLLDPLLEKRDILTGIHANTQIPKVIGFERIAELEGKEDWHQAAEYFWNDVVGERSVCIGGNSAYEHFHPKDNFTQQIEGTQGPETCNTYNMLRLTEMLYRVDGDPKFMDYYERALYNHILSTQNPETGGLVYFTQMRPGHYRVYSQPQTSMWCCVGSGIENHAKYGHAIYAHNTDGIYVNLFIASSLHDTQRSVELKQTTAFPNESATQLEVACKKKTSFTLYLRYPAWVKAGALKVYLNGKLQSVEAQPGGYVALNRKWRDGDVVRMEMPMHLTLEQLPDHQSKYAVLYGPIVLASKTGTDQMTGLFADDSRGGHIANGPTLPLQEMPTLVTDDVQSILANLTPVVGKPLTWTLPNVKPERWGTMELMPFYRLHNARYTIYWNVTSPAQYEQQCKEMAKLEAERQALDAITLDKVICGEQQPESDHFVKMSKSRMGSSHDAHWRETGDYFAYQMKRHGSSIKYIQLKVVDAESYGRLTEVYVNGTKVGAFTPADNGSHAIFKDYRVEVPATMILDDEVEVRVSSSKGTTARICEVRLVK